MGELNSRIWDEWLSFRPTAPVEDEIAGILDGMNRVVLCDGPEFSSGRIFAVRRLLKLWPVSDFREAGPIRITYGDLPKSRVRFLLEAGLADEIAQRISATPRNKRNWNWARGLWGSCGALYVPRMGYHMVIRPPAGSDAVERLLSMLKSAGFSVALKTKGGMRELMLRDQQQIVTFLTRLGFVRTALALEETAIYRSMRSRANKLVNCDSANINKTLRAAERQMMLIREMEEAGIVDDLPEDLRELVYARKKNPSVTLRELGQNLPRPISKSTVEYRWRKCENMLHKLLKGDGGHVFGKGRR